MTMRKQNSDKIPIGNLISFLHDSRFRFSKTDNQQKIGILTELADRKIIDPSSLIKYHDTLCLMQAYPGNAAISGRVNSELGRFIERIDLFKRINGDDDTRIDDTGMVNTTINYPYSFIISRWLLANFGADIDIDMDDYAEKENDPLSGILSILAIYPENDGIDDEDISSVEWIDKARGANRSALAWLLTRLDTANIPFSVKQHLYDTAELGLAWNLVSSDSSRTLAHKPAKKIFYQQSALKKIRVDLRNTPKKTCPAIKLVSKKQGGMVIERLIKALLPRHRELYPVLYANPAEVYETSPGRGLTIYIPGMRPDDRMPLETNYSALLVKNGVPIGYGIAVLLFGRCEIAINVFDTFRSGEATVIFDHFFRVFYHHFGAREFIMRKWQVGHENEEGLKSGSFWFYHKLGFRSIDPKIGDMAKAEMDKINKDKSYRTDLKTLKKLALSDMVINLGSERRKPYQELRVADIGMAVTRMIAQRFDGEGVKAERSALRKIKKALGNPGLGQWNRSEKLQFARFSTLLAVIPDLADWKAIEKQRLLKIIRAKAAEEEKNYVGLLQSHSIFKTALEKISRNLAEPVIH